MAIETQPRVLDKIRSSSSRRSPFNHMRALFCASALGLVACNFDPVDPVQTPKPADAAADAGDRGDIGMPDVAFMPGDSGDTDGGEPQDDASGPDPDGDLPNDDAGTSSVSVSAEPFDSAEPGIVTPGDTVTTKYNLKVEDEDIRVRVCQAINDLQGPLDTPEETTALQAARIVDPNNVSADVAWDARTGTATVPTDIFVPETVDGIPIEVVGAVRTPHPNEVTGMRVRLGLASRPFLARTARGANIRDLTINGSENVGEKVLRNTRFSFSSPNLPMPPLTNGQNTLDDLMVRVGPGPGGIARTTYKITTTGFNVPGVDLSQFRIFRDGQEVPFGDYFVTFSGASGFIDGKGIPGMDMIDGQSGDGVPDGTHYCVVAFRREQIIDGVAEVIFTIVSEVAGPGVAGASIHTVLSDEDRNTPIEGILGDSTCGPSNNLLCSTGVRNTGRIFDRDPNEALFTGNSRGFVQVPQAGRNVILSDQSCGILHGYAAWEQTENEVIPGSGCYDFYNSAYADFDNLAGTQRTF